mmetsp:Transcript_18494/g.25566  ORF Transcript_18494/g.25566 Transcript_18494/m.25566 type:complete len:365 (-) Transcript_18494:164-1258(-)
MLAVILIVVAWNLSVDAFLPFSNQVLSGVQRASRVQLNAYDQDKNVFGSKLMPDFTEEELSDIFKEFNITNFDINKDPELAKWAPSKQFFETYGFQNNTEKYKRKTMDVKMDFYSEYRKPILPQYKTFLADIMAMTFIQTVDSRYKYDALHAFGICTQYYTIMKGYALQDEIDVIFNVMMKAVGLDPALIRADAKRILSVIKESTLSEDEFLAATEGEIAEIFNGVRKNRFFKYTDAWGIGLARLMELKGVEPNMLSFEKWSKSLRWVFTPRLMQSYDEFCGDQLRMQGVEAMQKQLLIREKKRAAARLESKAAAFEDKKKALQELNDAIEERRQQLIMEQKALKKKYEPDAYEKILLSESASA